MASKNGPFRQAATTLAARLADPRRFIQVVAGARQVGKSTLVQQVTDTLTVPVRSASADQTTLNGTEWTNAALHHPKTARGGVDHGHRTGDRPTICSG